MNLDELLRQRREWHEKNSLVCARSSRCLSLAELEALIEAGQGIDRETCERCFTLHRRLLAAKHDAEAARGRAEKTPAEDPPEPRRRPSS